jgi:SulP family sulfate permease
VVVKRLRLPGLRIPKLVAPAGNDLRAGLVHGLVSIPDGLAAGLLAGLNPVAGLYGYLFGTLAGALATSSAVMSVQGTGAMAVIISDIPGLHTGPDAASALATLGVLTGLVMLGAGLAGLGSLVRYVPNSVLAGFVNAVAVNIILGQLSDFTGYQGQGSNRIVRALDTLAHFASFNWPTLAISALTLGLILVLERTRLGALGLFLAVVVSSALVAFAAPLSAVPTLADLAEVPTGLPLPVLPSLTRILDLIVPAFSLAFVGLVQGAAIGQSVPNPDGTYPDASGDFRGQGIANIVSGLLRGMPVGGSMSGTSLVMAAGGRGRYANLTAGIVMAVVVIAFGGVAGYVAMPSLAALLMLIGFRTLKPDQIRMVWRTGTTQATVMTTTFLLTLLVPMQYAVMVGVGISVILFVARQSNRVTVKQWVFTKGSPFPTETTPPPVLPPDEIVVLTPYGSLFFASASVFETQLPVADATSHGSVVILRMRGKEDLGSTFINTIVRYHDSVEAAGSHLVLTGIGDRVAAQLANTGAIARLGAENVFVATPDVGESLQAGMRRAHALQDSGTDDRTPN